MSAVLKTVRRTEEDRLLDASYIMDAWGQWMASDFGDYRELWYPGVAAGFDQFVSNRASGTPDDFEQLDGVPKRSIDACNAVIDGLRITHPELAWAINKTHGLGGCVDYARRSVIVDYAEAVKVVCAGLVARGIVE